jgi:DNA-directed RNA polymerase II subunit RPB1
MTRYVRVLSHKIQHECIIQGSSEVKKTYTNIENDQHIIETDGSNIDFMMNNPYFDYTKIRTNDIMNVYETLGIEAARSLLLEELRKVIEFDGTYVNIRHFLTLVDTMTYKGDIMAITRHGINKANTGPLMKCSFEETVDVLTEAAVFSESDHLKGVTENIVVGKMSNVGTGNIDLFMDI